MRMNPSEINCQEAFRLTETSRAIAPQSCFSQAPGGLGDVFLSPDNMERDPLTGKCSGAEQTWVRNNQERHVNCRVLTLALSCFCDTESHKQAGRGWGRLLFERHSGLPARLRGVCSQAGIRERLPKIWRGQRDFQSKAAPGPSV